MTVFALKLNEKHIKIFSRIDVLFSFFASTQKEAHTERTVQAQALLERTKNIASVGTFCNNSAFFTLLFW